MKSFADFSVGDILNLINRYFGRKTVLEFWLDINLPSVGFVRSYQKYSRFSLFDVYWIQSNKREKTDMYLVIIMLNAEHCTSRMLNTTPPPFKLWSHCLRLRNLCKIILLVIELLIPFSFKSTSHRYQNKEC